MHPNIIDWRITANCNQSCLYCYATDYVDGGITSDAISDEAIIEKILQLGCDIVCISGGEPLLDEGGERAFRIIKALKEQGINIFLSTNGTNYMQLEEKYGISKYLSKLSLPIDGYDYESSKKNGHVGSFQYVKAILEHFNAEFHRGNRIPNIKISTVVTRNNINTYEYWENLCKFINSYPIVKLWKIYDFVPENRGKTNKEQLSYTQDKFDMLSAKIAKLEAQYSIPIEKVIRNSRSQIYFIIRPDGGVVIPKDKDDETEELVIGNLLSDSTQEILTRWCENIKSEICTLYSNGRTIPDGRRYYEAPISRAILEEIAKDENKNNLYSVEKVIKIVSQCLNTSEQEIRTTLNSLTFGRNPIIREIIPIINLPKLGLQDFLINLVFNEAAGFTADEIADAICSNPSVGWCAHYKLLSTKETDDESRLDSKIVFRISIFASNVHECNNQLNVILAPIRSAYMSKSIDYVPEQYVAYDRALTIEKDLLDGRHIAYNQQDELKLSRQEETTLVAMSTFRCANGLCFENLLARLQSDEFSRDWRGRNVSAQLHDAIDSLRMKQIINMFQLVTNDKKRGYNTFLVIYDLHPIHGESEQELVESFKQYVEGISGVTHYNVLNLGDWNIDVEIRVRSRGEFAQIISKIDEKFGNEIWKKQYMELINEFRFTLLIPVVVEAIKRIGGK